MRGSSQRGRGCARPDPAGPGAGNTMRSVAWVALIAPGRGRASKKITNIMHTGAARFLWKPKWPWVKTKPPKPAKPPQPSTTVRAGCNARFLLREGHDSGALPVLAPERGPRWQTHAQRRNPGNLYISLHATDQAFRSLMPSSARGVDGGPQRFTQVVPNEQFLPVAGRKRNVRAPRIGQHENPAAVRDSGLPLS